MRGSMGPLLSGAIEVESLAVRPPGPRPGSGPFFLSISSPRLVPAVCDDISDFFVCGNQPP